MINNKPDNHKNLDSGTSKLLFVMLVVLIICGGNALGLLIGALIWKLNGSLIVAILSVVLITILAFIAAAILIYFHIGKKK